MNVSKAPCAVAASIFLLVGCGSIVGKNKMPQDRALRLRFVVDAGRASWKMRVQEDPKVELTYSKSYEVKEVDGVAKVPRGFFGADGAEVGVDWKSVGVVDSNGTILSAGSDEPSQIHVIAFTRSIIDGQYVWFLTISKSTRLEG